MTEEKFWTLRELAARLSVSYSYIWRCVRAGQLECVRLGDGIRVGESAVQKFLTERRNKRGPRSA